MQLKTLQIVWHGKEPVLSVDFQPNSHTLVSGGQDGEVKHWEVLMEDDGSPGVRFLSSYPVNSKSVNCVRFSPMGDMLASAGDKGEVLLWRFVAFASAAAAGGTNPHPQPQNQQDGGGSSDGGVAATASSTAGLWRQVGLLRGHCDDVLDLAWAPDGSALLTGGIENNCILWDVEGRKSLKWIQDHGHYVQGVSWDPLGRYIASQSADRTARVYVVKPPAGALEGGPGMKRAAAAAAAAAAVTSAGLARDGFYAAATLSKGPLPVGPQLPPQHQQQQQAGEAAVGPQGEDTGAAVPTAGADGVGGGICTSKQPLFCDDSLPTFFRRLAWSPDGAFLAAPAGVFKAATTAPTTNTTHIFARGDWSGPALSLPCINKGALVVRFCPRLYRAPPPPSSQQQINTAAPDGGGGAAAVSRLPYRIIMAVASVDSVVLYDMQALEPLAVLGGIHFAAVTDLAWSDDGLFLVVASRDGYCTVCSFEGGELGEPVPLEELPPGVAAAVSRTAARRHHERVAAAAAAAAAGKSAAAAAAAVATAPPPLGEQLSLATPPVPAAPQRIQPVPVYGAGAGPNAAPAAAGTKRPAEGEPATTGGGGAAGERPKPKRIQPIPLSATVLNAGGGVGGARAGSGGLAATAAAPAAAAAASPGRRRIVPTRVDGPSARVDGPALAAAAAAAGQRPTTTTGRSPLQQQPAASVGVSGSAITGGVQSRTPLTGGGGTGVVVPGVAAGGAAPESAVKMPTPQVLIFGTPPAGTSNPREQTAAAAANGPAVQPPNFNAAAASAAPPATRPNKPGKRVTPVPVDRGASRPVLGSVTAPPQPTAAANLQQQQPEAAPASCHKAPAVPRGADAAAAAEQQQPPPPSRRKAAAADGDGGGARLSVAQLAMIRGSAAARRAAAEESS